MKCGRCKCPAYCSKDCQIKAWKRVHKRTCGSVKVLDYSSVQEMPVAQLADVGEEWGVAIPCVMGVIGMILYRKCHDEDGNYVGGMPADAAGKLASAAALAYERGMTPQHALFPAAACDFSRMTALQERDAVAAQITLEEDNPQRLASLRFHDLPLHGAWAVVIHLLTLSEGEAERAVVRSGLAAPLANAVIVLLYAVDDPGDAKSYDGTLSDCKSVRVDAFLVGALANFVHALRHKQVQTEIGLYSKVMEAAIDALYRVAAVTQAVSGMAARAGKTPIRHVWDTCSKSELLSVEERDTAHCWHMRDTGIMRELRILIRNLSYSGVAPLTDESMFKLAMAAVADIPERWDNEPELDPGDEEHPLFAYCQIANNIAGYCKKDASMLKDAVACVAKAKFNCDIVYELPPKF
jgi:hypothetical protein